ncbi:hypothetical protein NL676_014406 [Syzygium grande]|nr:hypothetical protein NL676_014406 [Syzygium grande]
MIPEVLGDIWGGHLPKKNRATRLDRGGDGGSMQQQNRSPVPGRTSRPLHGGGWATGGSWPGGGGVLVLYGRGGWPGVALWQLG